MSGFALLGACGHAPPVQLSSPAPTGDEVLDAMLRATRFMRERCAVNGGYVWSYAGDFSRRWGALEAYESMIWIQPPGTATMGHLYLDCYHASEHEYFYESAVEVAQGLIAAQHPSGGWNYMHDFDGEESMRRWYDTIGRNGWRLEEFHHYYGTATFDAAGTAEASQFLLRIYLEKRDPLLGQALEKALGFVLDSQYDNGGWPLRHPVAAVQPDGLPDYTRHITFDEDVGAENIRLLLMAYQALGDQRALAAIYRAMAIYPATLQALPQAGWGLMHSVETLAPVGARSYEPAALVTSITAGNASRMMDFYEWTGEQQFLERLPEVFTWLDSVRLAADPDHIPGRRFPTFIELGSNKPLYNHRRGSNVMNGEYYHDYDPGRPIQHYPQWQAIDLEGLRDRFRRLMLTTPADVAPSSPLNRQTGIALPRYFTLANVEIPDLDSDPGNPAVVAPDESRVRELLGTLNRDGYWPTLLTESTYRYTGDPPPRVAAGDFSETQVGDKSDTSPFLVSNPQVGISTGTFVRNMGELMQSFAADESAR